MKNLTTANRAFVLGLLTGATVASSVLAADSKYHGAKDVDGRLVIQDRGQTILVQGWGRDSLRVRVTPEGSKQTSDWALDIPLESKAEIEITSGQALIRNGNISCRISDTYTHKLHIELFKHDGDKKRRILSEYDYGVWAHNPGVRTFKKTDQGLLHVELHLQSHKDERFYGMGLNATTGTLNLKGAVVDLYQRHVKHVVPFVVSSEGYGFLWNNPSLGRVEFGTKRVRWVSRGCRQLDYFITTGDSYADILSNYADATGHAPEFPYWASGFWMCKLRYKTQDEFLNSRAYLNLGMSGIPWGAAGIGGFVRRDQGPRFHELMIRWYQYGVFCPVFRTHGNRMQNEPWNLGGDCYRHVREAMFLRERLRPYVMKQMALASAKGTPPMRPVFFDFEQSDPKTAEIEDQFLFGPDLLVAPITKFEQRSRQVYLPAGTDWTDAWTGKKLQGGQSIEADAPIERIPVYLRGDRPDLLKLLREKAPKDP